MAIYYSGEEIVEMGIKIEEMGQNFYESYVDVTEDEEIKKLFTFLAGEEVKHKIRFQEILDSMKKGEFSISFDDESVDEYFKAIVNTRIFTDPESAIQLAKSSKNAVEAVNNAIIFEKDTLVFFYGFLELVKDETKDTIWKLIKEEKSHIKMLHDIKNEIQ
ncbi:ferritin family protein [candidate division KSB1 bacterium]